VILDSFDTSNNSVIMGGFLQDSWTILDKVTLNAGIRYDAQYIYGDTGKLGMALPNQFAPRIGVIFDPTQQGKSKIFANYSRYFEASRSTSPTAPSRRSSRSRRPTTRPLRPDDGQPGAGGLPTNANGSRIPLNGVGCDPNQFWGSRRARARRPSTRTSTRSRRTRSASAASSRSSPTVASASTTPSAGSTTSSRT
jgi:hypothetical protein